jgi:hypothetical protein
METNMSGIEQAASFVAGFAILVYAAIYLCCTNQAIAVVIGGILLATGGLGYCPLRKAAEKPEPGKPMSEETFNKNVEYRAGQTTKSKKPFEERQNLKR